MAAVALVSGRGSNLAALLEAIRSGRLAGLQIVAVIADRPQTGAEALARHAGIDVQVVDFRGFASRSDFDRELLSAVESRRPALLLALGFMRIFSAELVERYKHRLINIHPSLLPAFPGMHGQRQAFEYGVKLAGCTVHFVDQGLDSGPIILQAAVPVNETDDEAALAARILTEEHRILTEAVDLFVRGKLRIEGRRVRILE
ncbi:MAG: phosphoribosylglycinamide formyltransferase [Leptospirales bacterium]|nr:phosphoribosylglycinamide formyltransferase [Leptospirales bacterium]